MPVEMWMAEKGGRVPVRDLQRARERGV